MYKICFQYLEFMGCLVKLEEHLTLDLSVVSSSPALDVEIT